MVRSSSFDSFSSVFSLICGSQYLHFLACANFKTNIHSFFDKMVLILEIVLHCYIAHHTTLTLLTHYTYLGSVAILNILIVRVQFLYIIQGGDSCLCFLFLSLAINSIGVEGAALLSTELRNCTNLQKLM